MTRILLTAFMLMLAGCAGYAGNMEPPHVTLSNIVPAGDMTLFEQRYEVSLRVQNPNDRALAVDGMNFTLDLNGQSFARGVSGEDTSIPALGEEIVRVTVTTGALDWLRQVERIGRAGEAPGLAYEMRGALLLAGVAGQRLGFASEGTLFTGAQ